MIYDISSPGALSRWQQQNVGLKVGSRQGGTFSVYFNLHLQVGNRKKHWERSAVEAFVWREVDMSSNQVSF